MAPPVTEIAYIALKPGVDIEGSTPEAKAWQDTLKTLSQQDGMQRTHYGRTLEEPNLLMLFVDWDSYQHHQTFIASPTYGPFVQTLAPLFASLHLHHVVPGAFPPAVLGQAPVIEFATFFGAEPAFLANVQRFMEAVGEPDGVLGAAFGETVEADVVKHAEQGGEVEGGKAVVLLIGWTSKEMHMQFRETETFAKNIGLLREKCTGAEMFHVKIIA